MTTLITAGVPGYGCLQAAEQGGDAASLLTPDQLVATVLNRNPGLASVEEAAKAAAARIAPAGALDDPMISYAIAPRTIGVSGMQTGQMVEVMQPIPWFGTLGARRDAAGSEARAKAKSAEAQRLAVIAAAKAAFAEWYFIHEALRVNREQKTLAQDLVSVAEGRLAGGGLQQDVLQAEMELAMLDDQELNLLATRATIEESLKALMNSDPNASVPPPAPFDPVGVLPTLPALLGHIEAHHPEIQSAEAMVAARSSQVRLAEKELYPNFRVSTGYNSMWNMEQMRWTVGVSVNIPLNRGRIRSAVGAARADARETEFQLANRLAQLRSEVASAHASASRALKSIELLENRILPLARDTLEVAISEYRSGGGDFLSVIAAERGTLTTEQSLYRARADFYRQIAHLEHAAGGSLQETLAAPASSGPKDGSAAFIGGAHE